MLSRNMMGPWLYTRVLQLCYPPTSAAIILLNYFCLKI